MSGVWDSLTDAEKMAAKIDRQRGDPKAPALITQQLRIEDLLDEDGSCVYCGEPSGEYDEHEACVEAALEEALDDGS